MKAEEIFYTILKINPKIEVSNYCNGVWIGYYGQFDENSQAEIIAWEIPEDQPSKEEIERKWEEVKDSFVNPFLVETYIIPLSEFRQRLTKEELVNIKVKSKDDLNLSIAFDDLTAMADIELKGANISEILDVFVESKVITKTRKKELLKSSIK